MGHKISKEQIDPSVKDHIMSFVGNKEDLETSNTDDIINAVNSLIVDRVDNAANINKLANSIGSPVTISDNVDEVCSKLDGLVNSFKTAVMNNGIDVESADKFKQLIEKVDNIDINPLPKWYKPTWFSSVTTGMKSLGDFMNATGTANKKCMYIVNGAFSSTKYQTTRCYDTMTNTTSTLTNSLKHTINHAIEAYNDRVYIIGGHDSKNNIIGDVQCYDILTNTWSTKSSMPTGRYWVSSAIYNKFIYCIGGDGTNNNNKNECYDILTDTWSTKRDVITPGRYSSHGQNINGKLYFIEGQRNICYDPKTNTWETKTPYSTTESKYLGDLISMDEYIFFIGGTVSGSRQKTTYIYNTTTDSWVKGSDMPESRDCFAIALIDGCAYLFGGNTGSSGSTSYSSISLFYCLKNDL